MNVISLAQIILPVWIERHMNHFFANNFQWSFVSFQIVFPNGSIDPWHALGITIDVTSEEQAVFIEGISDQFLHVVPF